MYEQYRKWNRNKYRGGDGVLVGSDLSQEWLLPFWWEEYRKSNSTPVTWIDFGLSESMRSWCRERGDLAQIRILPELFISPREKIKDPRFSSLWKTEEEWEARMTWFRKPFPFLQSPYERTIYMDCDCEVLDSIEPMFPLCEPTGLSMLPETSSYSNLQYAGGVIVFKWGYPLFEKWIDACMTRNHEYVADDDLLSDLLIKGNHPVHPLPEIYHRQFPRHENMKGVIYHWLGSSGKTVLRSRRLQTQLKNL